MKKFIYFVQNESNTADQFGEYFDSLEDAKNEVENLWNDRRTLGVWLMKLNVEVPDDYNYTTAEQFYKDLFNEEITTSDFQLDIADWNTDVCVEEIYVPDTKKYYLKNADGETIGCEDKDTIVDAYLHDDWSEFNEAILVVDVWGDTKYKRVWHEGKADVDNETVLQLDDGYYGEWE